MSSNLPINKQIEKYIDEHSLKLHPVQNEIIKYNDTLGKKKKLQISINQCHFLYLLTKLFKPKKILEIGTFTGLSSLSMCIGLEKDSKITTLDKNKETSLVAKNFFEKAKVSDQIDIIIDEAVNSINKLITQKKLFDLIFIDADKENYKKYYELSFNLLKKDGFIIIDNVLWHGEVVDKKNKEHLTEIIRDFNTHVNNDVRVENMIIPIGDGFSICRKL
jgi:caffeoyl-CoA O-methyltransferase